MYTFRGKKYYTLEEFDILLGRIIKKSQEDLRKELDELDNINKHYVNV